MSTHLKSNAALMIELADSPAKPGLIGELNKRIMADPESLYAAAFRLYRRLCEAEARFTKAREAFLTLIAEARRVDEDTDLDKNDNPYYCYTIITDHNQFRDLVEALNIPCRYDEGPLDAVHRALEQESKS